MTPALRPRASKPNKLRTELARIPFGLHLFSSARQTLPASARFLLKLTSVAGNIKGRPVPLTFQAGPGSDHSPSPAFLSSNCIRGNGSEGKARIRTLAILLCLIFASRKIPEPAERLHSDFLQSAQQELGNYSPEAPLGEYVINLILLAGKPRSMACPEREREIKAVAE